MSKSLGFHNTTTALPEGKKDKAISMPTVGDLMQIGVELQKANKGWNNDRIKRNPNLKWIENYSEVKQFLNCGYAQGTQAHWRSVLAEFFVYINRSAKDFLELEDGEIKNLVKGFAAEKSRQKRYGRAWNAMLCINSFYEFHKHKKLHWGKFEKIRRITVKVPTIPTTAQVWRIADLAAGRSRPKSPRNAAIVLFDFMTALRNNALANARWGLMQGYSESDCPIPIKIWCDDYLDNMGRNGVWVVDQKLKKEKFGGEYTYTFLAKEGFLAVKKYESWHKSKIGSIEEKDFLFQKLGAHPFKQTNMVTRDIYDVFKIGLEGSGINPETCTLHKLRTSFKNVCLTGGVDFEAREAMMCHRPAGSAGFYWDRSSPEIVREQYMKCDWTIDGKNRLATVLSQVHEIQEKLGQALERNKMLEQTVKEINNRKQLAATNITKEHISEMIEEALRLREMQAKSYGKTKESTGTERQL
jgi:site-specific recombinase XerD